MPGEIAEGNFLVTGAIGTGKTVMHRELMRSVVPTILPGTSRCALVYDLKCDLLSELHSMQPASDVIVFNPADNRSVAWDIAADVKTPDEAVNFAQALILRAELPGGQFFTHAACAIVTGVINSLNRTHSKNWDLRRLILLTTIRSKLERVLAGSDLIGQYFEPRTFANIHSSIVTRMAEFKAIAALWKHTGSKISLKEWLSARGSILVLAENLKLHPSLQHINRCAFTTISTAFLSEPESPKESRLWFFCDDLVGAGWLDLLPALMNARSKGVRCVLGFQDIEGLGSVYGNPVTPPEILNLCRSISWLKTNSAKTAEWASNFCGGVLPPSEFQNLPQFASGNSHGVHMIKGFDGIFKASAHHQFQKSDVLDFDPRPESQQFLEPWGPDDDKWFEGAE